MSIQRLRTVVEKEGSLRHRVAAESQEVLQAQLELGVGGEKLRSTQARDLVPQRPHGIEPESLVPGGVGNEIGVFAVRVRKVEEDAAEGQRGDEATGRNRSAGMSGLRHVVVHRRTEGSVDEIELLQRGQFRRGWKESFVLEVIRDVLVHRAPGAERVCHGWAPLTGSTDRPEVQPKADPDSRVFRVGDSL